MLTLSIVMEKRITSLKNNCKIKL